MILNFFCKIRVPDYETSLNLMIEDQKNNNVE